MSQALTLDSKVLVLNRSFLPIHITPLKRAFCLLYLGVAKVVDEEYRMFDFQTWSELSVQSHQEKIGLVGKTVRVPRVILLQMYDKLPKKQIRFSRFNVYARDKNTCQYCGKTYSKVDLNLDHVVPRSQGGVTSWENIVCSCIECNRKKGGRTPREANMMLVREPKRPHWSECFYLTTHKRFYRQWKPFLNMIDFSYWNVELVE